MSYYELLQVTKDASTSEIKKSYYVLAKKYHPVCSFNARSVFLRCRTRTRMIPVLRTSFSRSKSPTTSSLMLYAIPNCDCFNDQHSCTFLLGRLTVRTSVSSMTSSALTLRLTRRSPRPHRPHPRIPWHSISDPSTDYCTQNVF